MPGYFDDDDNDDQGQDQSGPRGLREALRKAEEKLKERDAKIAELETSNNDLAKQVKSTTIRNALTDAGIDPKYARFAERDEVEPTVEAVKAWADENKDVYAFLAAKAPATPSGEQVADGDDDGDDDDAGDVIPADYAAQLLAAQGLDSTGRPGGSITLIDALEKVDVSKFDSAEQVDAYIRSLGAPRPGA